MEKKIIILGGGYAGVLTAKKLAKQFKKDDSIKITLIDKNRYHTMLTELHEVAANRVEEDSIRISLRRIFAGRKVEVVTDSISKIDYDARTLKGELATYEYDYLVVATGSQPAYFGIPGAAEYTYKLWSYNDAMRLKAHTTKVFEAAMNETDPVHKRRLLTFYISGAGFTGVEMAGELAEWCESLCEQFEIEREEVRIIEVDMLDRVVPVLTPALSVKAQRRLEKMGVEVILKAAIQAIGPGYIEYKKKDVLIRDETATVIWTAGTEGAQIAKDSSGVKQIGRGRIAADPFLRAEGYDNVFLVGDSMFYKPEGAAMPVPQMVENCEHSAAEVAHNMTVAITGQGDMKAYHPSFHGVMVCIGGRYGLALVGNDKWKIALPSFLAMFTKHFINIIYFVQVLGWNKVFSYIRHEFFTIRKKRSFVGGHFSNRTPSFLLAPLRVVLGFMWFFEGFTKIGDGWINTAKLPGFFGGSGALFDKIIWGAASATDATAAASGEVAEAAAPAVTEAVAQVASAATDAVASASTVVEGAATAARGAIINWDIWGLVKVHLIEIPGANHNLVRYALRVPTFITDWFRDSVILSSDFAMLFFQNMIVVSEIGMGLALMGGLFTFLAAGYSLVLLAMFLMMNGLYFGQLWMIAGGLAVMIGGGSTFGLDYYVSPWLKKQWKKLPWVKKNYLYND
ncbi:MAG: NAD(P)/FAD-dependent oxidoreductase [Eubacteriales bacterium]|nr:NAD(P)/FAD-dependent oxidoreductase [Eubacteriales bacterium]